MSEPVTTEPAVPQRQRLLESILDNLGVWTVVALLIGVLYLVWATLEILSKYVGGLPSVGA